VSLQAPGRLELVREFVNSIDLEDGPEQLDTPSALGAWLDARGLLEGGRAPAKADVTRAVELREALRAQLLSHHGDAEAPDPDATVVIERAARRAGLEVRFLDDGVATAVPAKGGVDGALGRLLAIVAEAQAEGTWDRLKACPWDTCRWAFYDRSKNRSGRWCRMDVCGNRAKAAAFRARARERSPAS
jgi:predicted RNA-binding Zn ribbon-like protein